MDNSFLDAFLKFGHKTSNSPLYYSLQIRFLKQKTNINNKVNNTKQKIFYSFDL